MYQSVGEEKLCLCLDKVEESAREIQKNPGNESRDFLRVSAIHPSICLSYKKFLFFLKCENGKLCSMALHLQESKLFVRISHIHGEQIQGFTKCILKTAEK